VNLSKRRFEDSRGCAKKKKLEAKSRSTRDTKNQAKNARESLRNLQDLEERVIQR
jgi:hypothetical protein